MFLWIEVINKNVYRLLVILIIFFLAYFFLGADYMDDYTVIEEYGDENLKDIIEKLINRKND